MASTACTIRGGMAESGTSRRFSRPDVMSAVMSGASSVTWSVRALAGESTSTCEMADGSERRLRVLGLRRREHDADQLSLAIPFSGHDEHGVPADRELALLLRVSPAGVAQIVEPIDELCGLQGLAAVNLERTAEDAGIHAQHLAMNARVDHPRENDVVVAEHDAHHEHRPGQPDEEKELPSSPAPRFAAAPGCAFLRGRCGCCRGGHVVRCEPTRLDLLPADVV